MSSRLQFPGTNVENFSAGSSGGVSGLGAGSLSSITIVTSARGASIARGEDVLSSEAIHFGRFRCSLNKRSLDSEEDSLSNSRGWYNRWDILPFLFTLVDVLGGVKSDRVALGVEKS